MGTLVVVRHAQASLFSRDYDELSEHGIEQARCLGRWWAARGEQFSRVVTGPAKRHRDTFRHAYAAASEASQSSLDWPEPEVLPLFDEHDAFALVAKSLPDLEGKDARITDLARDARETEDPKARSASWQRLFEAIMERWLADEVLAAGVESWAAFKARVDSATQSLLEQAAEGPRKQRILLVTSVGPTAALLLRATSSPAHRAFSTAWRQRNASISHFVFSGHRLTLDAFNQVDHLDPTQVTFR